MVQLAAGWEVALEWQCDSLLSRKNPFVMGQGNFRECEVSVRHIKFV